MGFIVFGLLSSERLPGGNTDNDGDSYFHIAPLWEHACPISHLARTPPADVSVNEHEEVMSSKDRSVLQTWSASTDVNE